MLANFQVASISLLALIATAPLSVSFCTMPPNQAIQFDRLPSLEGIENKLSVAILGVGMMGQEHISYISGYPNLQINYMCDPHEPSLNKAVKVLQDFHREDQIRLPMLTQDENDLLACVNNIDLLVIASPNYLHTQALLRWAEHDIFILVEKPVAVSQEEHDQLMLLNESHNANIWVAMEYRYIPAIAKLLQLLPQIGDLKMVTIRENRYPFLTKIGEWNRDIQKTGDTLVEKCCHFWDLFRLITGMEVETNKLRAIVQRGLNYEDEQTQHDIPIIDAAYVMLPFKNKGSNNRKTVQTIGCLELCMYAEGSRHQEEIIVTGTTGRLEAYLPENKVFMYQRPSADEWSDRSEPPPPAVPKIFDCSLDVHGIESALPSHGGYHYSSTSVEWYYLLQAMNKYQETGVWEPHVSLHDGLSAVQVGLHATKEIVNECK